MSERQSLAGIAFRENGRVEPKELNALYRLIGWDSNDRRTDEETAEMLRVSHYYIAAHAADGRLVGFARVAGDPYVAQVLDVFTHPDFRRRGIARRCAAGVLHHLQQSRYVSVTLTDDSRIHDFYQRFGFQRLGEHVTTRAWRRGTEVVDSMTADSTRPPAPAREPGRPDRQ